MHVNPLNVIQLLQKKFSKYKEQTPINAFESDIAKNFAEEIERCNKNDEEMEISHDLVIDENANYVRIEGQNDDFSDFDENTDEETDEVGSPFGSEKSSGSSFFPSPEKKTPRKDTISYSDKKKALQFYRSPGKGCRSLNCMKSNFRFIKSESDLKMIRRFEINLKSREEALKQIDLFVIDRFKEKFQNNLSISDLILRKWAIHANNSLGENKITEFKASKNWLAKFKKRHRIVSRKITKFISKSHYINLEKVKKEAEEFVECVKNFVKDEQISSRDLLNADQSGFELELHAKRSLAPVGTKLIECVVQSVSSTTHSYTVMPMITASGSLLSPLFIVLAEQKGKFPQKGIFQAKNIYAVPNTSHIMTKKLMIEWLTHVLCPSLRVDQKTLLLVDSWTGWNDFKPPENVQLNVKQIPKHATGICQPLDVYVFRMWKEFTRKITQFVLVYDININLHHRDNILKLQSLIHNQFQAERFNNWLRFSWRKAGYFDHDYQSEFCHPVKFCFEVPKDKDSCQKINCENTILLRCGYCEIFLCFAHFFHDYHMCENA